MIIATFTISRTYVVLVAFNAVRKETVSCFYLITETELKTLKNCVQNRPELSP